MAQLTDRTKTYSRARFTLTFISDHDGWFQYVGLDAHDLLSGSLISSTAHSGFRVNGWIRSAPEPIRNDLYQALKDLEEPF